MKTGDKVICINDTFASWTREFYDVYPVKGEIYTLRSVKMSKDYAGNPVVAVHLYELINPMPLNGGEVGYCADRFAPLVTKQLIN